MTTPDDFTAQEQENLFLIEHLQKLYDTQTQDEQALHAIGARLALSPRPTPPESVPGPGRRKEHQAPERTSFPLSLRPKVGSLSLLAATLVVVLLTGSFAAMSMFLQHHSPANGTPAHGSGTPAATTPCTQAYPVSGIITSVGFSNGTLGTATTVGFADVKGAKEQYQGLLGENFSLHFLKGIKVFEQQEKGCQSVSLTRLKIGQHIRVQFDGDIMQSAPPQILTQQLMIVADRGGGS